MITVQFRVQKELISLATLATLVSAYQLSGKKSIVKKSQKCIKILAYAEKKVTEIQHSVSQPRRKFSKLHNQTLYSQSSRYKLIAFI